MCKDSFSGGWKGIGLGELDQRGGRHAGVVAITPSRLFIRNKDNISLRREGKLRHLGNWRSELGMME